MDPNAALADLRETTGWECGGGQDREDASSMQVIDNADDMASAFQGLDEWLSKGGFLPEAWARVREIHVVMCGREGPYLFEDAGQALAYASLRGGTSMQVGVIDAQAGANLIMEMAED